MDFRANRFNPSYTPAPECGGKLRVIACIEESALVAGIPGHVQQREELNGSLAWIVERCANSESTSLSLATCGIPTLDKLAITNLFNNFVREHDAFRLTARQHKVWRVRERKEQALCRQKSRRGGMKVRGKLKPVRRLRARARARESVRAHCVNR